MHIIVVVGHDYERFSKSRHLLSLKRLLDNYKYDGGGGWKIRNMSKKVCGKD